MAALSSLNFPPASSSSLSLRVAATQSRNFFCFSSTWVRAAFKALKTIHTLKEQTSPSIVVIETPLKRLSGENTFTDLRNFSTASVVENRSGENLYRFLRSDPDSMLEEKIHAHIQEDLKTCTLEEVSAQADRCLEEYLDSRLNNPSKLEEYSCLNQPPKSESEKILTKQIYFKWKDCIKGEDNELWNFFLIENLFNEEKDINSLDRHLEVITAFQGGKEWLQKNIKEGSKDKLSSVLSGVWAFPSALPLDARDWLTSRIVVCALYDVIIKKLPEKFYELEAAKCKSLQIDLTIAYLKKIEGLSAGQEDVIKYLALMAGFSISQTAGFLVGHLLDMYMDSLFPNSGSVNEGSGQKLKGSQFIVAARGLQSHLFQTACHQEESTKWIGTLRQSIASDQFKKTQELTLVISILNYFLIPLGKERTEVLFLFEVHKSSLVNQSQEYKLFKTTLGNVWLLLKIIDALSANATAFVMLFYSQFSESEKIEKKVYAEAMNGVNTQEEILAYLSLLIMMKSNLIQRLFPLGNCLSNFSTLANNLESQDYNKFYRQLPYIISNVKELMVEVDLTYQAFKKMELKLIRIAKNIPKELLTYVEEFRKSFKFIEEWNTLSFSFIKIASEILKKIETLIQPSANIVQSTSVNDSEKEQALQQELAVESKKQIKRKRFNDSLRLRRKGIDSPLIKALSSVKSPISIPQVRLKKSASLPVLRKQNLQLFRSLRGNLFSRGKWSDLLAIKNTVYHIDHLITALELSTSKEELSNYFISTIVCHLHLAVEQFIKALCSVSCKNHDLSKAFSSLNFQSLGLSAIEESEMIDFAERYQKASVWSRYPNLFKSVLDSVLPDALTYLVGDAKFEVKDTWRLLLNDCKKVGTFLEKMSNYSFGAITGYRPEGPVGTAQEKPARPIKSQLSDSLKNKIKQLSSFFGRMQSKKESRSTLNEDGVYNLKKLEAALYCLHDHNQGTKSISFHMQSVLRHFQLVVELTFKTLCVHHQIPFNFKEHNLKTLIDLLQLRTNCFIKLSESERAVLEELPSQMGHLTLWNHYPFNYYAKSYSDEFQKTPLGNILNVYKLALYGENSDQVAISYPEIQEMLVKLIDCTFGVLNKIFVS